METRITTDTIHLTATLDELMIWQSAGLRVYATPRTDDVCIAVSVYIASQPQFFADYVIATVQDFLNIEGWDTLDLEEDDPGTDDTISLMLPRMRPEREA